MNPTKEEIKILESGTHEQKTNLGISHYGDEEWMGEALKYLKTEDE